MKKYLIISVFSLLGFVSAASLASAQNYAFNSDLTLGSQGTDVANLQSFLISNGYNIPAISSGAQSKGYFGNQTQAALAAYQRSIGIASSGYFDSQTRAWINSHGGNNNNGNNGYNTGSSVQVTSPNGGEVWQRNTTQVIRWNSATVPYTGSIYPSNTADIKLEFPLPACAQPGQIVRCMIMVRAPLVIASGVSLYQGSYNWNVGSLASYADQTQLIDGQYKIQICPTNGSACDDSDNTFTITSNGQQTSNGAPTISGVDAPTTLSVNQTGTWTIHAYDLSNGTLSYSVNWGDTSQCVYPYSCAANASAAAVVQTSTFSHSYATAGTYTVTFTVANSAGRSVSSSATVQVTGSNTTAGSLRIISPNGGEIWQRGTVQNITWTSPYYFAAAYADLKVTQTYNCTTQICPAIAYAPYTIASTISINQNSYSWNVGTATNYNGQAATLPDGQYSVQICQSGTSVCDSSDNTFTITSGTANSSSITVTSPNGGEQWAANSTQRISWNAYNLGYTNAVDIYLGKNVYVPCAYSPYNSSSCNPVFQPTYTLDRNIAANAAYNWIVGTDINNNVIPAGSYTIEACTAGSTTNFDTSNSAFTIYGTAYPANTTNGYNNGTTYYNNGYNQQTIYPTQVNGCPAGYICTLVAPSTVPNVPYSY